MLEGIFGNASAEKILLYTEQYGEGYATEIARSFDNLTLHMAHREPRTKVISDFITRLS